MKRILLVEDDPNLGLLLQDYLQLKGKFDVVLCKDGEEGLKAFTKQNFDLLILDVMMPKTDGLEILQRIKELHPRCEVIMLTAITSLQVAEKAMSLGAFDLIGKPFDVVDLRQKVIRAVAKVARNSIEPAPSSLLFNS